MALVVRHQLKGMYTALESLYWKCSLEGGPLMICLEMVLNLHNFVNMALQKGLVQIVNPLLLPREAIEMGAATTTIMAKEEADNNEEFKQIDANMQKFLLSIFNIGILCSMESPKERMSMEEVIKELQWIKRYFS